MRLLILGKVLRRKPRPSRMRLRLPPPIILKGRKRKVALFYTNLYLSKMDPFEVVQDGRLVDDE